MNSNATIHWQQRVSRTTWPLVNRGTRVNPTLREFLLTQKTLSHQRQAARRRTLQRFLDWVAEETAETPASLNPWACVLWVDSRNGAEYVGPFTRQMVQQYLKVHANCPLSTREDIRRDIGAFCRWGVALGHLAC